MQDFKKAGHMSITYEEKMAKKNIEKNLETTNDKGADPSFPIQINVVKQHDDGQVELTVSYSDDFKAWFMKDQGLKRWSEKRFQQVMAPMLQEYYDNLAAQQQSGVQADDTSPAQVE